MAQADIESACRALIFGEHKVCGLTRSQDAQAVYQAGAYYGGLIFYPGSPRYVDIDCAKAIVDSAPLHYVGVFVDAPIAQVSDYATRLKLAAVQLHGVEDEHYIQSLRQALPLSCQIWKAQAVATQLPKALAGVDRILYDTYSKQAKGGTGEQFNWQLLAQAESPFMLAGGLTPGNIADALAHNATGLDINSGVETAPGKKCTQKINAAFAAIRNY